MGEPVQLGNEAHWNWASSLNWAILFVKPDLTVDICNELGAGLLGLTFDGQRSVPLCQCLSPKSEEYQAFSRMIQMDEPLCNSLALWEIAGDLHHVLLDSYRKHHRDGSLAGMYVVARDLGNFMMTEQQLQRHDRLMTVGKVAAGVAHEIRNPLTTIKGFVQILQSRLDNRDAGKTGDEQAYLDMMIHEIDRVEFIVSDMLMLSNPRKLNKEGCTIPELFAKLRPAIDKRIANLDTDIDVIFAFDDLPKVEADEEMLTHALMNIISNALEAMADNQDGLNRVNALRVHGYQADGWIQIDISDTGPGIPYYQTDKIFDAFFTTKEAAVGLGLPICQRIVADHGGEIRVSSKGFGTTFHILLPNSETTPLESAQN